MPSTARRTGRPPRTSRAEILAAAQRLIDRDGWQQLTIRRLAAETGTAATTLYHHVRDREDLLIQLLDHYAEAIERPALPDNPRQRIRTAATTMRDALAAAPWIVEILTADDLLGAGALWMVEAMVSGALDAGCTEDEAVRLYRSIWYYTVGEILVRTRAGQRRERTDPIFRDAVLHSRTTESEWPRLAALADRWPELAARDTYADGLRALVDGLLPPRPAD
ncbi:TetR family transcriptional regulator [Nocardia panacis]|uniref:TetR family transcriptional regulator n=1 Tax=Nocardia panacis TaxID=2340916 RepID=A0A3A4KVE4_9NOCA|nr:TetR family transcriptional regulator [Nocardia panacis]RJO73834.1 TetR family transcriptional regulator [Nocardia panacis]